ncbi:pre-rRNA-processing protein esf1 [Entomophthora muscae]|uniref:Pre-rRNA-processing protein esf1 n=1 Tax=Entomophthora muscae TaxID=34485 RepID=A0ACC2T176_9FUNG|nr:pre-rRNA-processing protein esf1 [Entomophthora muscae]
MKEDVSPVALNRADSSRRKNLKSWFVARIMDWDNIKAGGLIQSLSSEFGKERMEYIGKYPWAPKEIFENPDHNLDVSSDEETLIQEDKGDEFNQEMPQNTSWSG